MQILQWLSSITTQEQPQSVVSSSPVSNNRVDKDHKVKSKNIVAFNGCGFRRSHLKRVEQSKLSCENLYLFNLIRKKDVSKTYFYHTLNLKTLASFSKRLSMKMKKGDIARGLGIGQKSDSGTSVGNKVLPITESAQSSSANTSVDEQCPKVDKKEKTKVDKTKTISRMKELLKWAAAAKSEKGGNFIGRKVLLFKNRTASKAVTDNEQLNDESPKISFRWEVESCSTTSSSVYSAVKHERILSADSINSTPLHVRDQWVARSGNWITTDSEFVVLEL